MKKDLTSFSDMVNGKCIKQREFTLNTRDLLPYLCFLNHV